MATSPIYGWLEPDNTDLVKNGALAIRTLGNAIDTTMGTMTPKSIVDAKGDLIAASANDTPARLAVGANGETLVADSSTSTGLRYQAPVNVNPVLNSAFQVWQRGTTGTANGASAYNADRWTSFQNAGSITSSRQATGDTTNLPMIQYCNRVQRNSGSTVTNTYFLSQPFETINSIAYAGRTVTLSFYARAGANFSASSNLLYAQLNTGTGTDQNNIAGFTGAATPINSPATLTTTWQRFSYTGTLASNITQLAMVFYYYPTGTAGANDWYEITGVQLEVGSVATPFKTYAGTIQGELAACQRYYVRSGGQAAYQNFGQGYASGTTTATVYVQYPVTMRTAPSALEFSTLALYDGASILSASALSLNGAGTNGAGVDMTVSGATQYRPYRLFTNNSTSGYLAFTAEL